ncbi:hypothetical protein MUB35_25905 [Blautia sp. NSJ-175]|uniref:hypothetical protein n=1 Tax=Blautia sp. NSJ-175 TaxID=2931396 RepID=UPI001FD5AD67|nr:hypothetical protein [Blautia sp. NSJ-175]MCJ7848760.1 hypothetical protein [Blautia sp. NSJ-175]DAH02923.1 MAG TPA: ribonuclease H [Caudoviricetes sp.]
MKRVRISIRICGKSATANLLYVDSKGNQHKSVKKAEKEHGDTREAVELKALIAGLKAMREPVILELSAPAYIEAAIKNGWLNSWVAAGGKKYNGKQVKCWDLWQQVHSFIQIHILEGNR